IAHAATISVIVNNAIARAVTNRRFMESPHGTSMDGPSLHQPNWVVIISRLQFHRRAHDTGSLMARCQYQLTAFGTIHNPFDLAPSGGHVVIRPERHTRVFLGFALDLAELVAQLALHQFATLWQGNLGHHPTHDFTVQRTLRYIARQPAGVLHNEKN